jgi:AcrR family transcriptional regulator
MDEFQDTTTRAVAVPRQKRALRTRAELLAATEALVAAEGSEAVTTTRVASLTGVSVGTIYRYFPDREALLLAAYDETVRRIVDACANHLATLETDLALERVVMELIGSYLTAAEAIPAHFALLREMRRLRPVADDRHREADRIETEILMPLFARFGLDEIAAEPGRLEVIYALLSTLVDLYLVTEDRQARANIRAELEAHALFALSRL